MEQILETKVGMCFGVALVCGYGVCVVVEPPRDHVLSQPARTGVGVRTLAGGGCRTPGPCFESVEKKTPLTRAHKQKERVPHCFKVAWCYPANQERRGSRGVYPSPIPICSM